jgi:hypothetical protein
MKTLIFALLLTLIATPALTGSATAASKGRRNSDRWQTYRYGSDESWRSYPFYNGTYKGRPVSDWLRPARGDTPCSGIKLSDQGSGTARGGQSGAPS